MHAKRLYEASTLQALVCEGRKRGHTTLLIIQPTKSLNSPNTLCVGKKEAADLEHASIFWLRLEAIAKGQYRELTRSPSIIYSEFEKVQSRMQAA
jgi:hypothetical protein